MIDSIWGIFTIGLHLGAPCGIAPGPMLILIISETLRHGIRAGAKVACTPLLTDVPLVLTSGFIFTQILNMNILLGAISLFGSVFLLYLGIKNIRTANADITDFAPRPLLLKELLIANLVNPNPYLFWFTVGAPLMVGSFQQTWGSGITFLFSFYLGLCGVKLLLAIASGKSRNFLHGILYRRIMQFLGFALIGFSIILFRDGLIFLGIIHQG